MPEGLLLPLRTTLLFKVWFVFYSPPGEPARLAITWYTVAHRSTAAPAELRSNKPLHVS